MAFILNGVTLPDPNSFIEDVEIVGDIVTTMKGGRRRAIHAKKKIWKLGWSKLTQTQVSDIKIVDSLNTTVTFSNSSLNPVISATVHMVLQTREYISGNGSYISSVDVELLEV